LINGPSGNQANSNRKDNEENRQGPPILPQRS
jgi:hypothetical protein